MLFTELDAQVAAHQETQAKLDAAERSLKNILTSTRRYKRRLECGKSDSEALDHIIRFCVEAGIVSSILRETEEPE